LTSFFLGVKDPRKEEEVVVAGKIRKKSFLSQPIK